MNGVEWQLLPEPIASSTCGSIYRMVSNTGMEFVAKRVKLSTDYERKVFEEEITTSIILSHCKMGGRSVAPAIYQHWEEAGYGYIAMEKLDTTIWALYQEVLAKSSFPVATEYLQRIVKEQIVPVLRTLAANKIMHLDCSGTNFMLCYPHGKPNFSNVQSASTLPLPQVYIIDMGFALRFDLDTKRLISPIPERKIRWYKDYIPLYDLSFMQYHFNLMICFFSKIQMSELNTQFAINVVEPVTYTTLVRKYAQSDKWNNHLSLSRSQDRQRASNYNPAYQQQQQTRREEFARLEQGQQGGGWFSWFQ